MKQAQLSLSNVLAAGGERLLRDANPWWRGERQFGVPLTKRWAFAPALKGLRSGLAPVTVLRGTRQVGKTTTLNQIAESLLDSGVDARRILRVQFDDLAQLHRLPAPILDLAAWYADNILHSSINAFAQSQGGPVYLLLDEVQNLPDWATQVKHLVDMQPVRAIVTGSSALRIEAGRDSLAGRLSTIEMGPLLLREIAQLRGFGTFEPHLPYNGLGPLKQKSFWPGVCRALGRACVEAGNGLSLGAKHSHAWRHGAHSQRRISPLPASTRRAGAIFGAIRRCRLVVGANPTPRRRLGWHRNSPRRRPDPKPDRLLEAKDFGMRHRAIRDIAFDAFSKFGAYPLAHSHLDATWEEISAQLVETVVRRAIQHDLRVGERGRRRDEFLLEEVFRLSCRYVGQSPSQAVYLDEVRRSLNANIGWGKVLAYLKFLDATLLVRLIPPLELRLKRAKGSPKLILSDHALRSAWLQEQVPLTAEALQAAPHLSVLAGHIAECAVGQFFRSIINLGIHHFPERGSEPEVDFVLTIGDQRIPVEVKYRSRIDHGDTRGLRAFIEKSVYNAPFGLLVTLNDDAYSDDPRIVTIPMSSLLLMR